MVFGRGVRIYYKFVARRAPGGTRSEDRASDSEAATPGPAGGRGSRCGPVHGLDPSVLAPVADSTSFDRFEGGGYIADVAG